MVGMHIYTPTQNIRIQGHVVVEIEADEDNLPVVFALWDLIRYDLPLRRGAPDLFNRLLCQGLDYHTRTKPSILNPGKGVTETYVGLLVSSVLY